MALIFHFEGYTGWTSKLKVQLNLAFEINCLALKKLKLSGFLKFLYRVKGPKFHLFRDTHVCTRATAARHCLAVSEWNEGLPARLAPGHLGRKRTSDFKP